MFYGNIRETEVDSYTITTDQDDFRIVKGFVLGDGGKITLSDDTALGVDEGFKSYIQVREV